MHLVLDSEDNARHLYQERKESETEKRLRALTHDIESNTISVANDNGDDVSNLLARMGKPMTAEQVQEKLKLCNSRLHFIRSPQFPELTGVYLITDEVEFDMRGQPKKKLKHICGMSSDVCPEFSVLHKTKKKIANPDIQKHGDSPWIEVDTFAGETRGWRTVLVRLLHAGLINMGDIDKHFPHPSRDSEKWFKCIN